MLNHCDYCGERTNHKEYVDCMYKLDGNGFDLFKCKRCGLIKVRPMPSKEQIASLYGEDYFLADYGSGLNTASYFESQKHLEKRYAKILDWIEVYKEPGELLEIGCAGGYFLDMAHKAGWGVNGVEISPSAGTFAKKLVPDAVIFGGSFPDAMFEAPEKSYDVVYMGHVLEHCSSPKTALIEANRLLRPGGLLVVEVPCYVSSVFYKILLTVNKIRKIDVDILKLPNKERKPYHVYEFSKDTLRKYLKAAGFKVKLVQSGIDVPETIRDRKGLCLIFNVLKLFGGLFGWQMEYATAIGTKR